MKKEITLNIELCIQTERFRKERNSMLHVGKHATQMSINESYKFTEQDKIVIAIFTDGKEINTWTPSGFQYELDSCLPKDMIAESCAQLWADTKTLMLNP